jgi:hypothetical protein
MPRREDDRWTQQRRVDAVITRRRFSKKTDSRAIVGSSARSGSLDSTTAVP